MIEEYKEEMKKIVCDYIDNPDINITLTFNGSELRILNNGKLHREDGPAIIDSHGIKKWYYEGNLHRLFEPAVVYANNIKLEDEWWYRDYKCSSIEEHITILEKNHYNPELIDKMKLEYKGR